MVTVRARAVAAYRASEAGGKSSATPKYLGTWGGLTLWPSLYVMLQAEQFPTDLRIQSFGGRQSLNLPNPGSMDFHTGNDTLSGTLGAPVLCNLNVSRPQAPLSRFLYRGTCADG